MKSSAKSLVVLYLLAIVVIHAAVFWKVREMVRKGYSDFAIYYCAGTIFREGLGHQLYDDSTQFRVQQEFAPDVPIRRGPLPYSHPPFEGLFFAPFSYLSYQHAFILWSLLNLAMLAALPFLLRPYLPRLGTYSPALWLLASLAFFPILFTFIQGQDAILLLFLYAMAFVSLKKDKQVLAGVWLALGLYKFHLVLPFVLLLLVMKKFRVLYGFIPVALILAASSIAVVGPREILSYPRYVLHLENTMARGAIVPADNTNLRGLLYVLLPSGRYMTPLVLVLSAGLLAFAAWKLRTAEFSFEIKFALATITSVLVSYHAMGYDLSMLLLAVFLTADRLLGSEIGGRATSLTQIAIAALFFSPAYMVLLFHYNQLAFMGLAVLLLFAGLATVSTTRRKEPRVERASVA